MSKRFLILLEDEPSPWVPGERLSAYVGYGARVLHVALAIRFSNRVAAKEVADRFPLSHVLELTPEMGTQRLESLPMLVYPSLDGLKQWLSLSAQEQQDRKRMWLEQLQIPDKRCPVRQEK